MRWVRLKKRILGIINQEETRINKLINELINRFSGARIFFLHVCARTRTRVVRLGAQCTDHWTTEQSCGVGVPAVQLTTHVKSSTLYGRTVVHPNFFGLMGNYYFV